MLLDLKVLNDKDQREASSLEAEGREARPGAHNLKAVLPLALDNPPHPYPPSPQPCPVPCVGSFYIQGTQKDLSFCLKRNKGEYAPISLHVNHF